jgi:transcriptional regulator with XRE-family HTH domain
MPTKTSIRDLRESKGLSQFKVRTACGLTYAQFVRIEQGSGKTTQEEIDSVLKVLDKMEPSTRKLAGRPFKDPARQKAVQEARSAGKSVAAALASTAPAPSAAPAKKAAPAKAAAPAKKAGAKDLAGALGKKAPAKKAAAAKKS